MSVKYTFKILLIGPSAVGKTSLLYRFTKGTFSEYKATLGVEFLLKEINLGIDSIKLSIWDIGGQDRFQALHKHYYINTQGALLVFDLTREETFEEMEKWFQGMKEILKVDIPFLLIGNKSDLVKKRQRAVSVEKAKKFAETHGSSFIETSAKTGDHVEASFNELTLRMIDDAKKKMPEKVTFSEAK